jgi:hypothetical protein
MWRIKKTANERVRVKIVNERKENRGHRPSQTTRLKNSMELMFKNISTCCVSNGTSNGSLCSEY